MNILLPITKYYSKMLLVTGLAAFYHPKDEKFKLQMCLASCIIRYILLIFSSITIIDMVSHSHCLCLLFPNHNAVYTPNKNFLFTTEFQDNFSFIVHP